MKNDKIKGGMEIRIFINRSIYHKRQLQIIAWLSTFSTSRIVSLAFIYISDISFQKSYLLNYR